MIKPTEETLMAYADDSLDAGQTVLVEDYIAHHPEARRFVDEMRALTAVTRAAFEQPMLEEPPARLVAAVDDEDGSVAQPTSTAPARGGVVSISDLRERRRSFPPRIALAAAAAVVAVFGAAVSGYYIGRSSQDSAGSGLVALGAVQAGTALAALLENQPSGRISAGGERRAALKVVGTFKARGERYCRELEIFADARSDVAHALGLACRDPSGTWHITGAAHLSAAGTPAGAGYKPSGSTDLDALGGVLQMVGAGQAVTSTEELELIRRKWK